MTPESLAEFRGVVKQFDNDLFRKYTGEDMPENPMDLGDLTFDVPDNFKMEEFGSDPFSTPDSPDRRRRGAK